MLSEYTPLLISLREGFAEFLVKIIRYVSKTKEIETKYIPTGDHRQ